MRLVDEYLAAIEAADAARILALFADDATVDSPLYGVVPARQFYPRLFRDTARSTLRLRSVMAGETIENRPTVAFWFDFDWTLSDGTNAPFTVVDVAELGQDGRIVRLHILYDTAPLRARFDALSG
jgi:ketosteroid isomerase-like protein